MSKLQKINQQVAELIKIRSGINLTSEDLQYLLLLEFNNQQIRKKTYYAFYLECPVPLVQNGKVIGIIAFAVIGYFAAPLLGIGALSGVLLGASIGWRLFGGAGKKTDNQQRIVSSPGFDSAPQPPKIGGAIPLIFTNTTNNPNGGQRVTGNVINSKIKTLQNRQSLVTLLALGLGEIVEVDNTNLLVDDQNLESFYADTLKVNFASGTINQSRFENYPDYSQVLPVPNNNLLGFSFRGEMLENSLDNNSFEVAEEDFDSFSSTEKYRVNQQDFRITNKIKSGDKYLITSNVPITSVGNRNIYATYRFKFNTNQKSTRITLNMAFDISARKESNNKLTTYAVVFDVILNGVTVGRFYEANKKEGTIRRAITLDNLSFKKHKIETYSYAVITDSLQPIRLDDSGVIRTIPSGKIVDEKEVMIIVESNPANQQSISKINGFLNQNDKTSLSSDRGANGKVDTVNLVVRPEDIGHDFMSNYKEIALNDIEIEASENISNSPAYSTLVKKGIKYRNHLAAGNASINSQNNILIATGTDLTEIFVGCICRNISRQTESKITSINSSTITTEFSLNWQPGESFLVYFEDAINYFPDVFVYTRLNKKAGVKGLKISERFIDYPSICKARKFCKDNQYFYDAAVENTTKWNEWASKESLSSLLFPFKYAGTYGLKAEENTLPTDIFNVARILPGSYSQSKPNSSTINCVQLTYQENSEDSENAYYKLPVTLTCMTADAYFNREELQIDSLDYPSITNKAQAKAVASKYLKSRILQNKVIEFKTSIAGFKCREGDLIIVQYALTEIEAESSGFCLSAQTFNNGSQEIKFNKTLDSEVTNRGYTLAVYHLESGTVETNKAFSILPNGNLLVTGLSEEIKPGRIEYNGDIIIINRDITEKIYRISSIKPNNYEVSITAVNWDSAIHDDSDLYFID